MPDSLEAADLRIDLRVLADMIETGARVLDVGCGDGQLIDYLFHARQCDARGLELDMGAVTRALAHGLPVMQGNADTDLAAYGDGAFDYVVLSRTLQTLASPNHVLAELLRIGRRAIVSFANFGHWRVRWQLLRTGRMPRTQAFSKPWHSTPYIHPCTILDFVTLSKENSIRVERWLALDADGREEPHRSLRKANLHAEQAVFLLSKLP